METVIRLEEEYLDVLFDFAKRMKNIFMKNLTQETDENKLPEDTVQYLFSSSNIVHNYFIKFKNRKHELIKPFYQINQIFLLIGSIIIFLKLVNKYF